jgi:hypothetical protein
MRVYVKPDGSVENQSNRYIALDSLIPDDPYAVETVTTAHTEVTNEQNKGAQSGTSTIRPTSFLGGSKSQFVGTEGCAGCHAEEHAKWQKTGHAKAMATLEKTSQQFDTECVGCHAVGFQKGGFQSVVTTPQYANVQCESCHGPGRQHADSPSKGYGFMPTPMGCMQCHTPKDSPRFNFGSYWAKVGH